MAFQVGQKVVCVDDSPGKQTGEKNLKLNAIYIIEGFDCCSRLTRGRRAGVFLVGLPNESLYPNGEPRGWNVNRFRPAIERKTDISIFTEILDRETVKDRDPVRQQ